MKFQSLVRPILGVVFAALGFYFSTFLTTISDQGVRIGVRAILVLTFGAIGIYLVPLIGEWLKYWSGVFARIVAFEVISQLRLPRIAGRGRNNKKTAAKLAYQNPIVVDTSALIDGRIAEVVECGFLFGTLIIPRFVLSELQHIADHADALRRGRGRRGLDVLESLKKSKQIKVVIYEAKELKEKNIDDKLIRLAKNLKAKILTTDFNLNKVATVSGIKILNINELVNALKTILLPGEQVEVKVIQEGKEKSQGVGYLSDGTMIVVENGATFIGKTVSTTVSRVLQTAAGRMIFVQVNESQTTRP